MAPRHDEIVRQLGDGWSIVWDTTEVDESTHRAMDEVIARQVDAFRAIVPEGPEEAERAGSATPATGRRSPRRVAA